MKKVKFLMMAVCAIVLASCAGKKQQADDEQELKSFEQEQIEESIKVQLDSIASVLGGLKALPILQQTKNGELQLTDEEKKVKPDYLLSPEIAKEAITLSEKYRVLVALSIDQTIAELYDMDTKAYNEATAQLLSDVNDPGFRIFAENGDVVVESHEIYEAEVQSGRINYFWQAVAASLVEQMYILCQNQEKFLPVFDDDAVANLTLRIALLQDAINRLVEYDPELVEVSEAIKPLENLNATTVDELKSELGKLTNDITAARNQLIP